MRGASRLGAALSLTAAIVLGMVGVGAPAWAQDGGVPPSDVATVESSTTTAVPTTTTPPAVPGREAGRISPDYQLTEPPPPPPPPTTAPPPDLLPENSGSGRRVVYSKSRQRVWAVNADGTVAKTHLVSGRLKYNQPSPGTYKVFSRSSYTCNIKNPAICWRYMIRFAVGGDDGDNIGLHEIPKNNGVPVQSISQLGQPLSGGCVRQAPDDALWMWNWAPVGTTVVVLG